MTQEELESRINKARKLLDHPEIDHFIVAEGKGIGASSTKSRSSKGAAHNARKHHIEWELKNGIDPNHARNPNS